MAVRPEPPDDGRVRTVFLGSGAFAVPALRALAESALVRIVAVVTAEPKQVGRKQVWTPTPVETAARSLGIEPVLTPPRLRHPDAIAAILALRPALAVLADYGQIVPPPLLDLPHGALNLHPSLLPRFRGASPVPAAILAGDPETAITLMRMDAGLDTGPLVAQERVRLDGTETAPELEAALAARGAALLAGSLPGWLDGSLRATPQPEDGVVLTRPLRREDGRLDPAQSAPALERMVRAYQPWPGTFLEVGGERVVVNEAAVAPAGDGDVPGAIVREGRDPALATPDGRLVLHTVTPAGKRAMPGADWLRGRRDLA
ncbi:MAG TPA: methionyl-tRNA formyltransferase [Candidatus Limnocylindrales bacterium]|nr:methionyl-tRNA formyltransferase [Candidatus Limnocylindrales bacterium]